MKLYSLTQPHVFMFLMFMAPVSSKTVGGVFSTIEARKYLGQYITSFCSHGHNSTIKIELNATGVLNPRLYMFFHEDWNTAKRNRNCKEKFEVARTVFTLKTANENATVMFMDTPRCWHLIYMDDHTCVDVTELDDAENKVAFDFLRYRITLFNPDMFGHPTEHFGDDELGLFRFYQLLTLAYFVLGCIFGPRMHEAVQKEGPMHLVIQLLTSIVTLQAVAAFLMMMHLRSYSKNGIGSAFFELLSESLDLCSQFIMLYMMLSLCLGRTLGGIYKPLKSFSKLTEQTATRLVSIFAILQCVLFMWEQYEERHTRHYHAHRSLIGILLAVVRTLLAALVAFHLYYHLSTERSAMKKDFYLMFTKCCMLWFLCYPVFVGLSWLIPYYLRYKVIVVGVLLFQSAAVILLYKLFLSRSLYWEVSALSSSLLPLKMDKSLTVKIYS